MGAALLSKKKPEFKPKAGAFPSAASVAGLPRQITPRTAFEADILEEKANPPGAGKRRKQSAKARKASLENLAKARAARA
jgi:hypothetical protein